MDLNEMNENWQKQAPMLAVIEKENPFFVPSGYFEKMADQIQSQITVNQFDTNNTILEIPENYFNKLEDQIFSAIKLEQLKETTASEIFTVPESYFNILEEKITSKIHTGNGNNSQSKVKAIFSTWITYAAAACIMAFIGVGIYLNTKSSDIESQFSQLPSDDIINYLQLYSDAGDAPIILESLDNEIELSDINSKISDQDIIKYLELNL